MTNILKLDEKLKYIAANTQLTEIRHKIHFFNTAFNMMQENLKGEQIESLDLLFEACDELAELTTLFVPAVSKWFSLVEQLPQADATDLINKTIAAKKKQLQNKNAEIIKINPKSITKKEGKTKKCK